MTDPRERLRRFFEWKGWSLREAARHLECDESYPGKILAGVRQPGLDLAFRIETLTAEWPDGPGPIDAREWATDGHGSSPEPPQPAVEECA